MKRKITLPTTDFSIKFDGEKEKETIIEWLNECGFKQAKSSIESNLDYYIDVCSHTQKWWFVPPHARYSATISFQEFESTYYPVIEDREIVGYECPVDFDGWETKKGDVFVKFKNEAREGYTNYNTILPKEIVEQWKPIYKEKELTEEEKRLQGIDEFEVAYKDRFNINNIAEIFNVFNFAKENGWWITKQPL